MEIKTQGTGNGGVRTQEQAGARETHLTLEQAAAMKKLSEARAGNMVLEQVAAASKQAQEAREAAKEKESQKEQNTNGRDRAQLTQKQAQEAYEAALAERLTRGAVEKLKVALLDLLLSWEPKPGQSLSQNLLALQNLYQRAYQAILQETSGELQLLYLQQLKEGMLSALSKVMGTNLGNLESLLGQYGEESALPSVLASLYRQASGERLSSRDSALLTGRGAQTPDRGSFDGGGGIYQRSGGGGVSMNSLTRENALSGGTPKSFSKGAASLTRSPGSLALSEAVGRRAIGRSITPTELAKTEEFAGYFLKKGGVFPGRPALRNEEMLGLLTGVNKVKAEVFMEQNRIGGDLSGLVRDAADRFLNGKLMEAGAAIRTPGEASGDLNYREALAMSQYVQNAYQRTRSHREALYTGYRAAYARYLQKRGNQVGYRYQEGVDFWGNDGDGEGEESQVKKGLFFLRGEWNQFVHSLRWENRRGLLLGSDFLREARLAAEYFGNGEKRKGAPSPKKPFWSLSRVIVLTAGILILAAAGALGVNPLLLLGGGALLALIFGFLNR